VFPNTDEPLDLVDPTGHYIVPPPNAGTSERIGNGVSSPSNFVADVATARVVEHAVITAPNNAAKAAAAHAALARVEAEQATAKRAAAQKAARAAAARRTALALANRKTAMREAAQNSTERLLFEKLAMSEAADVDGGKNITPPGEDLGAGTESIPVGDWGIDILGNPGHEGPGIDILGNPGHEGPGIDFLGNPGSDQGRIINADDPGTDEPGDGRAVGGEEAGDADGDDPVVSAEVANGNKSAWAAEFAIEKAERDETAGDVGDAATNLTQTFAGLRGTPPSDWVAESPVSSGGTPEFRPPTAAAGGIGIEPLAANAAIIGLAIWWVVRKIGGSDG
jgi:hypothetical protein